MYPCPEAARDETQWMFQKWHCQSDDPICRRSQYHQIVDAMNIEEIKNDSVQVDDVIVAVSALLLREVEDFIFLQIEKWKRWQQQRDREWGLTVHAHTPP